MINYCNCQNPHAPARILVEDEKCEENEQTPVEKPKQDVNHGANVLEMRFVHLLRRCE